MRKNFVSYGDAETLMTEVAEKIEAKGNKLYLHRIAFRLFSASEMNEYHPGSDAFVDGDTSHYCIGRMKWSDNADWELMYNNSIPETHWRDDYLWELESVNNNAGGIIKLAFLATFQDKINSFYALLSKIHPYSANMEHKIIFLPRYFGGTFEERADTFTLRTQSSIMLHIPPEDNLVSWYSVTDRYTDPECKLYIKDNMIGAWVAEVTEWN